MAPDTTFVSSQTALYTSSCVVACASPQSNTNWRGDDAREFAPAASSAFSSIHTFAPWQ